MLFRSDANSWKEEFFDTAEQTAAQTKATIDLGTYTKLIDDITCPSSRLCRELVDFLQEVPITRIGGLCTLLSH